MQFAYESQNTAHKLLMMKILDKEVQKVLHTTKISVILSAFCSQYQDIIEKKCKIRIRNLNQ